MYREFLDSTKRDSCKDCKFYVPRGSPQDGTCNYNPPDHNGWPKVTANDVCSKLEHAPHALEWRVTGRWRGPNGGGCEELELVPKNSPRLPPGLPRYYRDMAENNPSEFLYRCGISPLDPYK